MPKYTKETYQGINAILDSNSGDIMKTVADCLEYGFRIWQIEMLKYRYIMMIHRGRMDRCGSEINWAKLCIDVLTNTLRQAEHDRMRARIKFMR